MPVAFFGYETPARAVEERLGAKLAKYGVPAKLFYQFWLTAGERDAAYLEDVDRPPKSIPERWPEAFKRLLFQIGVPPADIDTFCSPEDLQYIIDKALHEMEPREGLKEMLDTLKAGGIDFMCCSGASDERVKNYFKRAGIDMPDSQICNAHHLGVHKPNLAVYKWVKEKYEKERPGETLIFAASHAWDVAGAKTCGFATAYTTCYEHYESADLWGKHDVVAPDLASLGRAMVTKWGHEA